MRTRELHERLLAAALDLAWAQWTAIGAAGSRSSNSSIVDPEALLIATLDIGRADARLFDESVDWLAANARFVDMARLSRLGKRASNAQQRLLGSVADIAIEHGAKSGFHQLAWAAMLAKEGSAAYGSEPLFYTDRGQNGSWADHDEVFDRAGFRRPRPQLRGMSRTPDATSPACLRFRVRALAGVGAKAEVLTYLLTHEWAHGRLIAERVAYNQQPVADYLSLLSDSGLVTKRIDGRRTLYRISEGLRTVAHPSAKYVDWTQAWTAVVGLLAALRPAGLSEKAEAVRLADAVLAQLRGLEAEGLENPNPAMGWSPADTSPENLVLSFIRALEHLGPSAV